MLTRKTRAELNRRAQEEEQRSRIISQCQQYGFRCRFLHQSVIISTPLCSWCFDYHTRLKTLYHESTIKINFQTGDPAKSHVQFRDRDISTEQVIAYIAAHDRWRIRSQKQRDSDNST